MITLLAFMGRHGPLVFLGGMVFAALFPGLAEPLQPYLSGVIIALLTCSTLQVDPRRVMAQIRRPGLLVAIIVLYLGVSPFLVWGLTDLLGLPVYLSLGVILLACAPPLTATVTFAALAGLDTAIALNLMVFSTLLTPFIGPFTVAATLDLPVWEMFTHLLFIVATSVLAGLLLRRVIGEEWITGNRDAINGLNTLVLLIFLLCTVGLAVGRAHDQPGLVAALAASTIIGNWGLQIAFALIGERLFPKADPKILYAIALGGGGRSMVLFVPALPGEVMEYALIFLGALQIPIYLTPLVMGPFYRWRLRSREQ